MKYWEGIRYLVWNDIRNARWKNLVYFVFIGYITLFTFDGMIEIFSTRAAHQVFESIVFEYLVIVTFSSSGLVTTHIYGYGWKKDLLAERLSYWRSLPIKIDQIVWARIIGVSIFSFLAVALYYLYIAIYMKLNHFSFDSFSYMLHGLTVFAIIYGLNLLCLFMEMSTTFKNYTIYCWITPFAILAIMVSYKLLLDFNLMKGLHEAVQTAPYVMTGASVVLIIACCLLGFRLINEKIRTRNLL